MTTLWGEIDEFVSETTGKKDGNVKLSGTVFWSREPDVDMHVIGHDDEIDARRRQNPMVRVQDARYDPLVVVVIEAASVDEITRTSQGERIDLASKVLPRLMPVICSCR